MAGAITITTGITRTTTGMAMVDIILEEMAVAA